MTNLGLPYVCICWVTTASQCGTHCMIDLLSNTFVRARSGWTIRSAASSNIRTALSVWLRIGPRQKMIGLPIAGLLESLPSSGRSKRGFQVSVGCLVRWFSRSNNVPRRIRTLLNFRAQVVSFPHSSAHHRYIIRHRVFAILGPLQASVWIHQALTCARFFRS